MTKKKKLTIEWPKSHFTIQDIQDAHTDAKNITLRYRISKAIENGLITYIGKNDTKVGRPTIVFSPEPVTSKILESAVESGILLDESFGNKVVDVAKATTAEGVEVTPTVPATTKQTV